MPRYSVGVHPEVRTVVLLEVAGQLHRAAVERLDPVLSFAAASHDPVSELVVAGPETAEPLVPTGRQGCVPGLWQSRRVASEIRYVDFDGHQLAYRVSGHGPALVVLSLYRRRPDMAQARMLSDRWQVFQVAPLGYGYSERVPGYAGELLRDQVQSVLDRHGVDRFVVWGYSAGAAMALCIARATPRSAGLVCGGFAPRPMTPGVMRQLDRRLRPDHPSRSLWWWYNSFDWSDEVRAMSGARLFYWGSEDRQMAKWLRGTRDRDAQQNADFLELPGLDHGACNPPESRENPAVPAVADWISRRLGPAW
jgi:pimeloyl-ACP methyl ester carboxylesterase